MLDQAAIASQSVRLPNGLDRSVAQSKERRAKALFVAGAGVSFLFSVSLWFAGYREEGVFVGLWVPSILSLGALLLASRRRS